MSEKHRFINALRPFSLIVAFATCGLGISLAIKQQGDPQQLAWLVMVAGVLLQISVNLINDIADLKFPNITTETAVAIRRNARIGWLAMAVAIMIGLYIVSIRGWPLLVLGIVGAFGAWAYTGGTINYKQRGLGIVLVFFLMGVMMVGGVYYAMTGQYHWNIFWLSIPFSLLTSLLLLSNELRDYEEDKAAGIGTLTVRRGYSFSVSLYYGLLTLIYLCSFILYSSAILASGWLILLALLALSSPLKLLNKAADQRKQLVPLTGRFYFVFACTYLVTIWTN